MKKRHPLGDMIAWARLSRRMSLRALARRARVAPSTVSRAERGLGTPSFEGMRALAAALGRPLDWFTAGALTRTDAKLLAWARGRISAPRAASRPDQRARR